MNINTEVTNFIKVNSKNLNLNLINLDPKHQIQWCPGCGNFGIVMAIKKAIIKLGLDTKDVLIVSGIGCSSKLPHYIKTYGIETIHGRALPVATGAKLTNKDLHVIVVGGDGDGYGIGMGHLMHTMRRNINITYLINNNEIYALTKGQTSPTTPRGNKTPSTPNGSIETAVNPIELALAGGATFIARGFSSEIEHLADLIAKGISHKGFSLIDIAQICVSYNPEKDFKWYQERIYKIEEVENYNNKDKCWIHDHSIKNQDKIGIGIYYHNDDDRGTYCEELPENKKIPLVKQKINNINVNKILDNYE
jgi:2-oxoglutarate ferredoxin oxidoreductase subunit beta